MKLKRILLAALELYLSGEEGPRGCFTVLTSSSDAIADPEIRALVVDAIEIDGPRVRPLVRGRAGGGRIAGRRRSARLARMAVATIHTLSIRARARIPKAEILPIIDDAVATICGGKNG